jgi:hypothetical protein
VLQPAPAPRFSRSQPELKGPSLVEKDRPEDVLKRWGLEDDDIDALKRADAI